MKKQKAPFQKNSLKSVPKAAEPAAAPAAPAAAEATQAPAGDEFAMEAQDVPIVQLAAERLQNARLHAQNRQNEFNSLVAQVQAKYQESGKYVVTGLDTDRGVVTRHLAAT